MTRGEVCAIRASARRLGEFAVAAGKAANLVGERPMPLIARFERLAYPMRGEVTNRAVLGRKRHGRPGHRLRVSSGGNDLGGKQTRRPEDYRMTAAAKYQAAQKSLSGIMWHRRPSANVGKADVAGEETGKCTLSATVVRAQGSEKRFAEITPGRTWMQQGLTATCNDCGSEPRQSEAEDPGSAHEPVVAMTTG
jgi:hypothetical protein